MEARCGTYLVCALVAQRVCHVAEGGVLGNLIFVDPAGQLGALGLAVFVGIGGISARILICDASEKVAVVMVLLGRRILVLHACKLVCTDVSVREGNARRIEYLADPMPREEHLQASTSIVGYKVQFTCTVVLQQVCSAISKLNAQQLTGRVISFNTIGYSTQHPSSDHPRSVALRCQPLI